MHKAGQLSFVLSRVVPKVFCVRLHIHLNHPTDANPFGSILTANCDLVNWMNVILSGHAVQRLYSPFQRIKQEFHEESSQL